MQKSTEMYQEPAEAECEIDTGLICLVSAAKILGIPTETDQIRRAYVIEKMNTITILRGLKDLKIKTRLIKTDVERISRLPLPAIAILKDGTYVVLTKTDGKTVSIIDPLYSRPFTVPYEKLFENWDGDLILVSKRYEIKAITNKKFGLTWLLPELAKYKRFFGESIVISVILQIFGLISPFFTQVIIDKVLVHRSLNTLDIIVLGMAVIAVFQVWMSALRSYLLTNTTNKIDATFRSQLFRHITALPIQYFETWKVGDVVSRIREMDVVRQFITGSALTAVLDTVFACIYVAVMYLYDRRLAIIATFFLLTYALLYAIVGPILRRRMNDKFLVGAEKQAFLIETITGVQTLKAMGVEGIFIRKYEDILARFVKAGFATLNLVNLATNIGTFIQTAFTIIILWVGAHFVMENELSVGALIAFKMLAGLAVAPIMRLINLWQSFQQVSVSIDRLGDIMDAQTEPVFNPSRTTLPSIRGDIVIDNVSFRYETGTTKALDQISLHIKAGTCVGIVGRSGSGKSTLTKLIQRLYVPEAGRVLIDGVDLAQVEPAWLRRQIGVVLQESYLFNGTIKENIAIASPNASLADVMRVARLAGADDFIQELPQGYDTKVGERGTLLSGGQKQRIAIARALMTDPRILIFDEATSSLDYESEGAIMDNLDNISAGRTLIMIAHRLSTIRNCDHIYVVERGRILEEGSHEALIKAKGLYYHLYRQGI